METLWETILTIFANSCFWLPIVIVLISVVGLAFRRFGSRQEEQDRTIGLPGMKGRAVALFNLVDWVAGAAVGDGIDRLLDIVWPDKSLKCPRCNHKLHAYVDSLGIDKGEKKYICKNCGYGDLAKTIEGAEKSSGA